MTDDQCNGITEFCCSFCRMNSLQDETGVYKNLLQEIAQRVGAPLPQYTTYRSGLGHQPVFTGTVELAGITFTGEPAKNKKQAEKNAALAAWSSLKQCKSPTQLSRYILRVIRQSSIVDIFLHVLPAVSVRVHQTGMCYQCPVVWQQVHMCSSLFLFFRNICLSCAPYKYQRFEGKELHTCHC